jgi:hypothetical protein
VPNMGLFATTLVFTRLVAACSNGERFAGATRAPLRLAIAAAARACGDHAMMAAYRKLVLPYGANVPGPPGMSLVRIGTWLMVIAHCSIARRSVLSTTRGMGCKALRGTVCQDVFAAISASFALQHFWRHLASGGRWVLLGANRMGSKATPGRSTVR